MSDALINGLAGAGGGIIAQLITYPLQTVNTRQQTDRDPEKEKRKLGTVAQMCQVVKHEGWERLYGGLTPSLVGTAASQYIALGILCFLSLAFLLAYSSKKEEESVHHLSLPREKKVAVGVYYYFYQIFRTKAEAIALERRKRGMGDGSVGMFASLLVAAVSGCVNVLMTNPIWVVVTRMQTHTKASKKAQPSQAIRSLDEIPVAIEPPPYGTSHAIQEVYDEAGFWGFWKGVIPTLIMVSNPSIQFMLYETLLKKVRQRRALKKNGINGVTALEIFLLGAVAKLGATVVTYPLLVVKSRLQAKQRVGMDTRHHYKGTIDAVMKMIQYEGLSGFYKGMSTKIAQSVLAAAILFMVKEELVNGFRLLLGKNAAGSRPP